MIRRGLGLKALAFQAGSSCSYYWFVREVCHLDRVNRCPCGICGQRRFASSLTGAYAESDVLDIEHWMSNGRGIDQKFACSC